MRQKKWAKRRERNRMKTGIVTAKIVSIFIIFIIIRGDSPNVETITTGAVVAGPQKQTGGAVGGGKKGKKKKDIDEDDM